MLGVFVSLASTCDQLVGQVGGVEVDVEHGVGGGVCRSALFVSHCVVNSRLLLTYPSGILESVVLNRLEWVLVL